MYIYYYTFRYDVCFIAFSKNELDRGLKITPVIFKISISACKPSVIHIKLNASIYSGDKWICTNAPSTPAVMAIVLRRNSEKSIGTLRVKFMTGFKQFLSDGILGSLAEASNAILISVVVLYFNYYRVVWYIKLLRIITTFICFNSFSSSYSYVLSYALWRNLFGTTWIYKINCDF